MSRVIHVLGATGRTGTVICRALVARGDLVVPVVRSPARWRALGVPGVPLTAEFSDQAALGAALADAGTIINASYAGFTGMLLQAAPTTARLVQIGSARRYGPLDNPPAVQAAAAEARLLGCGRDAVMLHPTMIYGAPDDGTIRRLASLIRHALILPLPGGGRHLVQPIHVADLAAAVIAAADRAWPAPAALAVAGPEPVSYVALIRAIAHAMGCRMPLILPIPGMAVRMLGQVYPALPRLLADRSAEITAMQAFLGVTGRPLAQGLSEMFAA